MNPADPASKPPMLIPDEPPPRDTQGEVDNAVDLLIDVVTGQKSLRDVAATAFYKAFGGGDSEATKPAEVAAPKLRAVDGGSK